MTSDGGATASFVVGVVVVLVAGVTGALTLFADLDLRVSLCLALATVPFGVLWITAYGLIVSDESVPVEQGAWWSAERCRADFGNVIVEVREHVAILEIGGGVREVSVHEIGAFAQADGAIWLDANDDVERLAPLEVSPWTTARVLDALNDAVAARRRGDAADRAALKQAMKPLRERE